jgi:integrase
MMHSISEKTVALLPLPITGNKVHFFSGATLQGKKAPAGFGVRVTSGGTKSFVLFHRADGRKHLETLGRWDENAQGGTLTVRSAIIMADKLAKDLKLGRRDDARPERTRRAEDGDKADGLDVSGLLDNFVERYVKKDAKLRSAGMIEQQLERLVKPRIGKISIYKLRRSQVSAMLNEIADDHGPRMADLALAYTRKAFSWYEVNGADDDFRSPIVRGMARSKPKDRERKRILADDEVRDVWTALETIREPACFATYVKTLLLTATRRTEAADMSTTELDGDVWTVPAARYKTGVDHVIPLSASARKLIYPQIPAKRHKNVHFIFSTTSGEKPFSGFSKAKTALDKAIADIRKKGGRPPMEGWVLHDLRRTARTLMSRAGVQADHAERCLGHVIAGVRGVYDRYAFVQEKREAFEKLAAMVDYILKPQQDNVLMLRR